MGLGRDQPDAFTSERDGSCLGLADYHLHSTASSDGHTPAAAYVERAIALGLREIGFAEHADFDPRDHGYGYFDYSRYLADLEAARNVAAGRIAIRTGLEVTYQRSREDEIRRFLADKTLDYCLGSVHLVESGADMASLVEPGDARAYFASRSLRQAYLPYWAELRAAVVGGLFDLLGHLDVAKRYAADVHDPFQPEVFAAEIREILRLAVERGIGLEINTSGWRQGPGEPYPTLTVLCWYRELGGEIVTFGSDAHRLEYLGYGLPRAAALAKAAGFSALALYEKRRVRWLDLP